MPLPPPPTPRHVGCALSQFKRLVGTGGFTYECEKDLVKDKLIREFRVFDVDAKVEIN